MIKKSALAMWFSCCSQIWWKIVKFWLSGIEKMKFNEKINLKRHISITFNMYSKLFSPKNRGTKESWTTFYFIAYWCLTLRYPQYLHVKIYITKSIGEHSPVLKRKFTIYFTFIHIWLGFYFFVIFRRKINSIEVHKTENRIKLKF